MLEAKQADGSSGGGNGKAPAPAIEPRAAGGRPMTSFVESCVETVAGSAVAVERITRDRPKARKLLKLLAHKKNVLVTTHQHPDPDALASSLALTELLGRKLPGATVSMSIKGQIAGGINEQFTKLSNLKLTPWDDRALPSYDAIILLDTQPNFAYSPLPPAVVPTAVIDHHRSRKRKPRCPFCDIRTDVGATSSILFSYWMELEEAIPPGLGATLLFAIESDLAGSAGAPGELDNMALSSLTLIADTRTLYKMRYVDLPRSYYVAYAATLKNAAYADGAVYSHCDAIQSLETPAVMADFLLRFEAVQWSLVSALSESADAAGRPMLVLSLRTSSAKASAAELMKRLLRNLGEGGGHRAKAGGAVQLETGSPAEVERVRAVLRRRYLRALGIPASHRQKLVP